MLGKIRANLVRWLSDGIRNPFIFTGLVAVAMCSLFFWYVNKASLERDDLRKQVLSLSDQNLHLEARVTSYRILTDDVAVLMKLNGELFDRAKDKMNGRQIAETSAKIIEMAKTHANSGVTVALICGLIEAESGWDPKATSYGKDTKEGAKVILARGLTQMLASTANFYVTRDGFDGTEVLYDPVWSVQWGVTHLVDLHKQFMSENLEDTDDFHLSVMAYFWGERLAKETLAGSSSDRVSFPALGYWKRVREAQVRWREKGF